MTDDECWEKAEEFLKEFKQLVRKYVPVYPENNNSNENQVLELLFMMQDRTSCFSPYIWSD